MKDIVDVAVIKFANHETFRLQNPVEFLVCYCMKSVHRRQVDSSDIRVQRRILGLVSRAESVGLDGSSVGEWWVVDYGVRCLVLEWEMFQGAPPRLTLESSPVTV